MKTSAEKLKMLRELKGLSQADCAKALGLDRTTYVSSVSRPTTCSETPITLYAPMLRWIKMK